MLLKSPDPQPHVLALNWQDHWTSLLAIVIELAACAWYLTSVRRLSSRGRSWPVLRVVSFLAGMAAVAYAVEGGIAQYQTDNFTARVVQILLLVDIAPPFLALGAPVRLALQSSQGKAHTVLRRVLRSRPVRAVTQPLVAFAIITVSMYIYFLTPLYSWCARHPAVLAYVDLHFLVAGWLLCWVVVARDALPRPPRTGMRFALVLLSIPSNAYLGLAIASATKPLFPAGNTLADTRAGGNILWALAEVFIVAALSLMFVEWAKEEERKAIRADRQLDAALAAARGVVTADGHRGHVAGNGHDGRGG